MSQMGQWAVVDFVSRMAERVGTAREGLTGHLVEGSEADDEALAFARLQQAFPMVEPSPAFVVNLYERLMSASPILEAEIPVPNAGPDRRIVYGAAALGSLALAATTAAIVLRTRVIHRAA